ncbi:hypothetical protein VTL71DRAFT_4307 [Oculimacula yallundae]|uniref:Uncharacterized protein n=1 Tax=Oculimacula yallundae TaxID=86028 RepID=A0ABR4C6L2_9HELO
MEDSPVSANASQHPNSKDESAVKIIPSKESVTSRSLTISPLAPRALKREIGYGDFCFGRQPMDRLSLWPAYSGYSGISEEEAKFVHPESNNILVPEMEGFQRQASSLVLYKSSANVYRNGSFPFFDLPLDVRRKIFWYLVGPLFKLDDVTKKYNLRLAIQQSDPYMSEYFFKGGLDGYLAGRADSILACGQALKNEYAFHLRQRHRNAQSHPERSSSYVIEATVLRFRQDPKRIDIDWLMIDLVRHLSNVSTQFRYELGSVVWRNIHLESDESHDGSDHTGARGSLLNLLEERPAIHQNIKSIHIKLNCRHQGYYNLAHIAKLCQYPRTNVELTTFQLELLAEKEDLEVLILGRGPLSDLLSIRDLKISSEFKFRAYVDHSEISD